MSETDDDDDDDDDNDDDSNQLRVQWLSGPSLRCLLRPLAVAQHCYNAIIFLDTVNPPKSLIFGSCKLWPSTTADAAGP